MTDLETVVIVIACFAFGVFIGSFIERYDRYTKRFINRFKGKNPLNFNKYESLCSL